MLGDHAVTTSSTKSLSATSFLADDFPHRSSHIEAHRRLRSASSSSFVVRRTRLSPIGDRAFPVAA